MLFGYDSAVEKQLIEYENSISINGNNGLLLVK